MNKRSVIENLLNLHHTTVAAIIRNLNPDQVRWLDFSIQNTALDTVDLKDTPVFERWLSGELQGKVGVGGFLENRAIYRRSAHFDGEGEEARSIHLGVDIWIPAGTPVYAPWEARVHSFRDNEGFGNYGPTIILEHTIDHQTFYTLYGHLSRSSLSNLKTGQPVAQNTLLGEVGPYPENGDWPPHLHFQVMTDLLGWVGDFPGVVVPSQQADYAKICIDPRYLLRLY